MERIIYEIGANQPTEPSHLHAQCNNRNSGAIFFVGLELSFNVRVSNIIPRDMHIFFYVHVNPVNIIRALEFRDMEKIKSK